MQRSTSDTYKNSLWRETIQLLALQEELQPEEISQHSPENSLRAVFIHPGRAPGAPTGLRGPQGLEGPGALMV